MTVKKSACLILVLIILSGEVGLASEIGDAISKGKVSLNLRYRFEFVNQDEIAKDAKASTIRLRLGYTTGRFRDFDFHLDMEAIRAIGYKDFNSTANNMLEYPVVADPEDTELNQAFLSYNGANTLFRAGRQRIKLDNDRFIGNVGWRQNEQTYDAFKIVNTSIPNTIITLAHIENVSRIFGEHHSSRSDIDLKANIGHLNYAFSSGGLSAYGHFFENQDVPDSSHQNLGFRFTGGYGLSKSAKLLYTLEYATQTDYKHGADIIDANYRLLELGCAWDGYTAKAGYEVLGGDGAYSFSTPFATLHAFNGWADKFLSTPLDGLVDRYFLLSSKLDLMRRPLTIKAFYHIFKSDHGDIDYGEEWDFQVLYDLGNQSTLMIKYANYNAQGHASDTKKLWVQFQYSF